MRFHRSFGAADYRLLFLEQRTLLSAGVVDTTFGDAGKVVIHDSFYQSAAQVGGKVLAMGLKIAFTGNGITKDYSIYRFTSGGKADATFGSNGVRLIVNDSISQMVALKNGKVILVDSELIGSTGTQFTVRRLNANGSDDLTFGPGGKVTWTVNRQLSSVDAIALQGDSVVIGGTELAKVTASQTMITNYLARIDATGYLDYTFGLGGVAPLNWHPNAENDSSQIIALAVQADGKIVAAGYTMHVEATSPTTEQFSLARFTANGQLDSTFGSGGRVLTNFGGNAPSDVASAVLVQPDGKIVAGGSRQVMGNAFFGKFSSDFAVARYNPNGSLDATFGNAGKATYDIRGGSDAVRSMALQPDGKIVLFGDAQTTTQEKGQPASDFALVRILPDGRIDSTFGTQGKTTTNLGGQDNARALFLMPDGRLVAAGIGNNAIVFPTGDLDLVGYTNDIPPLDHVTAAVVGSTLQVYGTPGDDVIVLTQSAGKVFVAGIANGFPTATFSRVQVTAFAGNDRVDLSALAIASSVNGGDGNDTLTGSQAGDTLDGGNANDSIIGANGNDVLLGGAGHDNLNGNNGNDTLDGGAGPDRISGGAGIDTADYHTRTANLVLSIDNVTNDGEAGEADNLVVDVEVIYAGAGNDLVIGSTHDDTLFGDGGDDTLRGGDGNDYLNGGPGKDQVFGDAGNDQLYALDGQSDLLNGGAGFDKAKSDGIDTKVSIEGVLA